mmetsp:Transcript_41760/g.116442  ORF Transcript_41760/g.116442 Transcript_41760/m.116442 type:complete len:109 (-) Transcript_41760:55-381(-)
MADGGAGPPTGAEFHDRAAEAARACSTRGGSRLLPGSGKRFGMALGLRCDLNGRLQLWTVGKEGGVKCKWFELLSFSLEPEGVGGLQVCNRASLQSCWLGLSCGDVLQ